MKRKREFVDGRVGVLELFGALQEQQVAVMTEQISLSAIAPWASKAFQRLLVV
jgi:hypothetical protein